MPIRNEGAAGGLVREQLQAGIAALKDDDAALAREIFTTLLEVNPQLPTAHIGLGRVYAAEGDHQRALEHFQEALALQPDMAAAQFFSAEAREKLGNTDEALADYREAVESNPSLGRGYMRMARLLTQSSRGDEALETMRDAVRHAPQDVGVRLMLSNALAQAGKLDEARDELKRSAEIKPDLWMPHYQLGKLLLQGDDFAGARASLLKAVALASDQWSVHQALGSAYSGLGEHDKAARSFDEAFRLKPTYVRAATKAAQARSAAGRPQEGLAQLQALGRVARRSGLVQKALGDIYLEMGQPREAVECYRALILNAQRLRESSPQIAALAEAPVPVDVAGHARRLRDAIGSRSESQLEELRGDPSRLRELRTQRRKRLAG